MGILHRAGMADDGHSRRRRHVLAGAFGLVLLAGGCGQLLGLGDFEDAEATGAGGSGAATTGTTTTGTASTTGTGGATGTGGSTGTGMVCAPGTAVDCYTGPAGTENTGLCKGGSQVCDEDGAGYGACEGEVLPVDEDCATPEDDDCDGEKNEDCPCQPGTTQSCYTGPAGTEGVGVCAAGTQKCKSDGLGWEACTGDVLPGTETCVDPADEDCNATECVVWAKQYGDASDQYVAAIDSDSQDNVIVGGSFTGGINFGGGNHFSVGANDLYLAKLKPDGGELAFTTIAGLQVRHTKVDPSDNVIVAAAFVAPVVVNNTTYAPIAPSSIGYLVLKVDPSGAIVWVHQLNVINVTSLAVSSTGDVACTGLVQGSVDLGTGILAFGGGGSDAYLVKLSGNDGHTLWAKLLGSAGFEEGTAVAFTAAGKLDVTGYYSQAINLGGDLLPAAPNNGLSTFFGQFSVAGAHAASTSYPVFSYPSYMAVPSNGNVYLGLGFTGSFVLGAMTITSAGGLDGLLIEGNSVGYFQKVTQFGGPGDDYVESLTTDVAGNLLLGASYQGAITIGGTTLAAQSPSDQAVFKLDAQGNVVWARGWPTISGVSPMALGAGKLSLRVLVGLNAGASATLGGITTVAGGGGDALVASFLPQ